MLKKDVDDYNNALKNGTLKQMNPPCSYRQPHPIAKAPFFAIPYEGGMTATFGGPLINTKAEVQTLEGHSIPGLYAAGKPLAASSSATTSAVPSWAALRSSAVLPAVRWPPVPKRLSNART